MFSGEYRHKKIVYGSIEVASTTKGDKFGFFCNFETESDSRAIVSRQ